jgi:hypothetical protein
MKKYLVAAVLVASFAAPALADQFYVVFDPASHKCEMMHSIPFGKKSMVREQRRDPQGYGFHERMRIAFPSRRFEKGRPCRPFFAS